MNDAVTVDFDELVARESLSGEEFLAAIDVESFQIAHRAMERIHTYTGFPPTRAVALSMLNRGQRVLSAPAWIGAGHVAHRRIMFLVRSFGVKMLVLITPGDVDGVLEWVATYDMTGKMDDDPVS